MTQYLSPAADLLMIAASLGAAAYCFILSRRLSRLSSFDAGIGGAIAVLSQQVDEMKAALSEAKSGTDGAGRHLQDLVRQAQDISGELELMIAACHDFAEQAMEVQSGAETPGRAEDTVPSGAPGERAGAGADAGPVADAPGRPDMARAAPPPVPEPATAAVTAAGDGSGAAFGDDSENGAIPIFGSRRAPPSPVFRRHVQG